MIISLEEAKQYLRVDFDDEDTLIAELITTSENLCADIARMSLRAFSRKNAIARIAVLYTIAYLYEHREEADYKALNDTLQHLLANIREVVF